MSELTQVVDRFAEITEIKVVFHDERRGQEEYSPPMKKAEVSLFAAVPEGVDPLKALDYVSNLVRAKVKELLSTTAASATLPPTSDASPPASQSSGGTASGEPQGEPQRRTRRTRAQIEADEAAARAAAEAKTTSGSATDASQASPPAGEASGQQQASPPSDDGKRQETASDDEWAAAEPEATPITDQELNHTCSVTAERVKDAAKVKAVIAKFSPGGDAWDPAKGGRRFTVNDIPQNQRAQFIADLKAVE